MLRMVIEIDPRSGGQITVNGPIDDMAACDHLLAAARRLLEARWAKAQQEAGERRVIVPEFRFRSNGGQRGQG